MIISSLSSYIQTIRIAPPEQIIKNLTKIAIPVIALSGAAMVHTAQAVTMAECFENCDKHRDAHELAKLICYALCAIFSKG